MVFIRTKKSKYVNLRQIPNLTAETLKKVDKKNKNNNIQYTTVKKITRKQKYKKKNINETKQKKTT